MPAPDPRVPPVPLANVTAVVGSDGSGKSTLCADLLEKFDRTRPTELLYLGQDSGNILIWVRGLPVIGEPIGRFLKRRSERAHAKDDKPAAPDAITALVIYALSRWRYHKFKRLLARAASGVLVITDRYPQDEVAGFYFDGPGLPDSDATSRLVRWLTVRERLLYRTMAAHRPALVIRLNIDAATAFARKPDHKLKSLEAKTRTIPTLRFNGAEILDLDSRSPYPQVLSAATEAIDAVLAR